MLVCERYHQAVDRRITIGHRRRQENKTSIKGDSSSVVRRVGGVPDRQQTRLLSGTCVLHNRQCLARDKAARNRRRMAATGALWSEGLSRELKVRSDGDCCPALLDPDREARRSDQSLPKSHLEKPPRHRR